MNADLRRSPSFHLRASAIAASRKNWPNVVPVIYNESTVDGRIDKGDLAEIKSHG